MLAASFLGFACGAKYNAIVFFLCFILWKGASALRSDSLREFGSSRMRTLGALCIAFAAAFFLSNPYFIIDYGHAIRSVAGEFHHYMVSGHFGMQFARGREHLQLIVELLAANLSWSILLITATILLASFLPHLRREQSTAGFVIILCVAAHLTLFGISKVFFDRNYVVLLSLVSLVPALGLSMILVALRPALHWPIQIAAIFLCGVSYVALDMGGRVPVRLVRMKDTRSQAAARICELTLDSSETFYWDPALRIHPSDVEKVRICKWGSTHEFFLPGATKKGVYILATEGLAARTEYSATEALAHFEGGKTEKELFFVNPAVTILHVH